MIDSVRHEKCFLSFFRNPTYNETKAIEITAKNYERADLSFVSTFLELGFTFTAQNKTDLTQHFTMLPCPEGTYSMGTLGCVECPPGKSVNVIVPPNWGDDKSYLRLQRSPLPFFPQKGARGWTSWSCTYSIIDYVDNRAKEISYSKLCLLPEECFEISLVS